MKMNRAEMGKHAEELFSECIAIHKQAQKEYTLEAGDAFDNFNRTSQDLKLAPEKVLWIFFKKHLDGVLNYINGHKTQRESIHGRIKDAINYLALLDGMITDKEKLISPNDNPYINVAYVNQQLNQNQGLKRND